MSRQRRAGGFVIVALLACAWPAHATTQQPSEAALIQRVESLLPEYNAALAARDARLLTNRAAAAERPPTPIDTVQVGPMRVVALPDEIEAALELFGEVWREDFPGVTESPSLRAHTFAFQWRARLRTLEIRPYAEVLRVDISRVWAPTRDDAKRVIADVIARTLIRDFPPGSAMSSWLTAQAHPDVESVYRMLAATNSGAARDCLAGEVAGCMASLGIGLGGAADKLPAWFSGPERIEMVERAALAGRVDRDGQPYRRCVEENDARACDPLLRELDWVAWVPLSDRLRPHVLWYAAREGGEGAWQRALERRESPMPDVLAHVAGRPIQQLVADWRTDVIAQRPDVNAGLGGRGTRVLLWSLVFAAFALRSTRWRLG